MTSPPSPHLSFHRKLCLPPTPVTEHPRDTDDTTQAGKGNTTGFNELSVSVGVRSDVSGEQLLEPAIGGLGDDDGHVSRTALRKLLHLLHHGLLVEPPAHRRTRREACWKAVRARVGPPRMTHPSWGPPRRTRIVSSCLPVARSTDASRAAFSSSSPRPETADTARAPEHGVVCLPGWG